MGLIQFVGNYDDLSTDKGYQFKFYCDKCRNGYMSKFHASKVGIAGSVLRTAGSLFGGWMSSAGYSSYDLQRVIGGPEHDAAMREAMEEGKQYFKQCTRCGKWVCPQVCWNEKARLCEDCAPDFEEQMSSSQAQAKADAARQQIFAKAQQQNYVSDVDLRGDQYVQAPDVAPQPPSTPVCGTCGADVGNAKFCPQCGKPVTGKAVHICSKCNHRTEGDVKFCPECGNRF